MPKMKTRRCVAKRCKITAGGKIMRRKAYHSHILTKKTRARKRRLRSEDTVSKAERKRIRTFLQAKAQG